jgi:hypothetical protein
MLVTMAVCGIAMGGAAAHANGAIGDYTNELPRGNPPGGIYTNELPKVNPPGGGIYTNELPRVDPPADKPTNWKPPVTDKPTNWKPRVNAGRR